jgi:hypothetical protein
MNYSGSKSYQAMVGRGKCIYTYPAPDYFELPKRLRKDNIRVAVVINEDMTISLRQLSKNGAEGLEIVAPGFPLKPTKFCGEWVND